MDRWAAAEQSFKQSVLPISLVMRCSTEDRLVCSVLAEWKVGCANIKEELARGLRFTDQTCRNHGRQRELNSLART